MWERHRSSHDPMISPLPSPAGAAVAVNNRVVCDRAIVAEVMAVRLPGQRGTGDVRTPF
jgi:hypothetical protein